MLRLSDKRSCSPVVPVLLLIAALTPQYAAAQSGALANGQSSQPWDGRRIVTLKGFGDYFVSDDRGQAQLIRPEGLGVNIVAVAQRLEGNRI